MPCAVSEARHWTGHKSRLDRDLKNRFDSRDYAAEELAIRRLDQDLRHCYVSAVVFDVKRLSDRPVVHARGLPGYPFVRVT